MKIGEDYTAEIIAAGGEGLIDDKGDFMFKY